MDNTPTKYSTLTDVNMDKEAETNHHLIYKDLAELSYGPNDKLDVCQISRYDHWHYDGTKTVEQAIKRLGIKAADRILDIGSGIGGPSRFIAHVTNCQVTAVEVQDDLNDVALDLTQRCSLSHRVEHICSDFLDRTLDAREYDYLISLFTFLHIPEKDQLFNRCFQSLKRGGKIYIEDYFERFSFTSEEINQLVCTLPTKIQYVKALRKAGFDDIEFEDVTDNWTAFASNRTVAFKENSARHIRVYGFETYTKMQDFHNAVASIFEAGHLGGVKIVASKPD